MIPLDQLSSSSKTKYKGKGKYGGNYESFDRKVIEDPLRGPRIPPQDLESEKALLGSLLLSSDALFDISDTVNAQSFYAAKHQIIFEVIEELVNKKEPVDILTVSAVKALPFIFFGGRREASH